MGGNNTEVKKGSLLISMPFLGDPNFERSVVLMCDHSQEGAFGLVLNQKTNFRLSDFNMFDFYDDEVYLGGPVEANTVHYIHSIPDLEHAIEIKNNIYWSGNFEQLKQMADTGKLEADSIRFYLGYSGWGQGQIEEELERNSWIVNNDYSTDIFKHEPQSIWRRVLRDMGGEYAQFANYPIDPNLN